jgi:site-specific recombinase XerD
MRKITRLIFDATVRPGYCPYRVVDANGRPISLINDFLDGQAVRNLSPCSLRAYAFDLLNFARWWIGQGNFPLSTLTEARLPDYIRYQLAVRPAPRPATVNHRITTLRCLYRFHAGSDVPGTGTAASKSGPWHSRMRSTVRLKQPRQVVVPLSPDEVFEFWQSFRTWRDLSIVALMLANGLRSHEVLGLLCADVVQSQACLYVIGKGNKQRMLPLSDDTSSALNAYLLIERPRTDSPFLFVSLKGKRRGRPMTPAGLRSLFRHHRKQTGITRANPHRFRHTFGSDMVRAGVSLPALMQLMGHASIHTTLRYTQLCREDVWQQYRSAMKIMRQTATRKTP